MKITIMHDVTNSFGRGTPKLEAVYDYEVPDDEFELSAILEAAFFAFNEAPPTASPVVAKYRLRGLRSLSVGDVVVVGHHGAFRCDSAGWSVVDT